jgi:hypothetical protein
MFLSSKSPFTSHLQLPHAPSPCDLMFIFPLPPYSFQPRTLNYCASTLPSFSASFWFMLAGNRLWRIR